MEARAVEKPCIVEVIEWVVQGRGMLAVADKHKTAGHVLKELSKVLRAHRASK